jgi:hypothetical protein
MLITTRVKSIIFVWLILLVAVYGCFRQSQKKGVSESSETLLENGEPRFPTIAVENGGNTRLRVIYRFRFESRKLKISLRVDEAVYKAANKAEKVALVPAEMKDEDLSAELQSSLMDEAAQAPFYDDLLFELRAIKDQMGLDDDRYEELIITFVQQIEYCDQDADNPKFPIETFVDKCGDCDDKSRLLAALLSREGYEVMLLLFSEEQHMAVGIPSPPLDYKGTGYAYVETTSPAFVGFLADENTNVKISSNPKVIAVGDGKKPYGKGKAVAFLRDTFQEMKECIADFKPRIEEQSEACRKQEAVLADLKKKLDRTPKSDPVKRKAATEAYNRGVGEFNALVGKRNEQAEGLNTCATVHNHILKNAFDRPGVHRWVKSALGE